MSGWTSSDGPVREQKKAAQQVFRLLSRVPGAAALRVTWGAVLGLSFSSQAVIPAAVRDVRLPQPAPGLLCGSRPVPFLQPEWRFSSRA